MGPAETLPKMTADEFIRWAIDRPEGEHYELVDGEVVAMAPERVIHTAIKGAIFANLRQAIRAAGLACEAYTDGLSIRIDNVTSFEPDVTVRCGLPLPPDTIAIDDPLVLVEVLSPASYRNDRGAKLEAYFRLRSVHHYLIVKTENRAIIHHARATDGEIATRIIRDGRLTLDPPGIVVTDVFA